MPVFCRVPSRHIHTTHRELGAPAAHSPRASPTPPRDGNGTHAPTTLTPSLDTNLKFTWAACQGWLVPPSGCTMLYAT
eukprot:scaffold181809_cov22-Tisochrysis_lutea.AAC.1